MFQRIISVLICLSALIRPLSRVQVSLPPSNNSITVFYLPMLRYQVAHLQLQLVAGCSWIQRRGAEWRQRGQRGGGAWSTNRLKGLFTHCFPP